MAKRESASATEQPDLAVMLARSLFRTDKWDPTRDPDAPFDWDDQRQAYLKKSRRLLNVIGKDGMILTISANPPEEIGA